MRKVSQMPTVTAEQAAKPSWLELQRIVTLVEGARLAGVSLDTLKRRHGDKIIKLSPRRRGIRVGDALLLNETAA
jgi:hypothetical protein